MLKLLLDRGRARGSRREIPVGLVDAFGWVVFSGEQKTVSFSDPFVEKLNIMRVWFSKVYVICVVCHFSS